MGWDKEKEKATTTGRGREGGRGGDRREAKREGRGRERREDKEDKEDGKFTRYDGRGATGLEDKKR